MSEALPKEVSRSTVRLGDLELECVVLDNGQRVFVGEQIEAFVKAFKDSLREDGEA